MMRVITCAFFFVVSAVNAQGSLRLHVAEDVESSFAVSDYTPHGEVVAAELTCKRDGQNCGKDGFWRNSGCFKNRERTSSCPSNLKSTDCCGSGCIRKQGNRGEYFCHNVPLQCKKDGQECGTDSLASKDFISNLFGNLSNTGCFKNRKEKPSCPSGLASDDCCGEGCIRIIDSGISGAYACQEATCIKDGLFCGFDGGLFEGNSGCFKNRKEKPSCISGLASDNCCGEGCIRMSRVINGGFEYSCQEEATCIKDGLVCGFDGHIFDGNKGCFKNRKEKLSCPSGLMSDDCCGKGCIHKNDPKVSVSGEYSCGD